MAGVSSTDEELAAWLRAAILARLELAREASPKTDGHWWRRTDERGEPVSHLWAGEALRDEDGNVWSGEYVVVYDEGAPGEAQFDHMAANDPRDTIARCEAELAILDLYEQQAAKWYENAMQEDRAWTLWPVIALLAGGYRYRPGYREEWAPGSGIITAHDNPSA